MGLGIFIFTQTFHYPSPPEKGHPGPDLFPNLLAILFILFGGTLVIRGRSSSLQNEEKKGIVFVLKRVFNALFVLGVGAAYVAMVNLIGFLITSALLLFVLMKQLGVTLYRSIAASIAITLFINLMFSKILRVPLPFGILGW